MQKSLLFPAALIVAALVSIKARSQDNPPPPPPPKVSLVKFKPPDKEFYKRNPSVADISWTSKDKILITLKKGNKEEYDFGNKEQKEKFIDKYGTPPPPPPPPPPPKPKLKS